MVGVGVGFACVLCVCLLCRSMLFAHARMHTPRVASTALRAWRVFFPRVFVLYRYRTLRGFCVLVEKELCSFGYQFARRSGTGAHRINHQDTPRAPIFMQVRTLTLRLVID